MLKRLSALVFMAFAITTCVANSATFKQISPKDIPDPSVDHPTVVIKPYIQNVTTSGVTILWMTDAPSTATVNVTGAAGAEDTFHTTNSSKLSEVRVEDLAPDTTYKYSVLIDKSGARRPTTSTFKTLPATARPMKFLVYGDDRSFPNRHLAVVEAMMKEKDVDFVLNVGDIIHDGRLFEDWRAEFFSPAAKMINHIPFFAALGNHEQEAEFCSQFLRHPGTTGQWWYSIDLPNIHITVLDSNVNFRPGSEQNDWLLADLEAHKDVKWKFLMEHHLPFGSGDHGSKVGADGLTSEEPMNTAREVLPPLATKYGTEVDFFGHDHDYERSNKDGVYYITTGGGGAENHKDGGTAGNPYRQFFYSGLHYCVVTIDGDKGHVVAKTPDGKILDEFDIVPPTKP